mmetsp:Transcript_14013/g.35090  ORF Transcript_14013/g.35090 Transcript_14013/m.35090 type:complete len:277 (+) Transcript_14013:2931-3761(+)
MTMTYGLRFVLLSPLKKPFFSHQLYHVASTMFGLYPFSIGRVVSLRSPTGTAISTSSSSFSAAASSPAAAAFSAAIAAFFAAREELPPPAALAAAFSFAAASLAFCLASNSACFFAFSASFRAFFAAALAAGSSGKAESAGGAAAGGAAFLALLSSPAFEGAEGEAPEEATTGAGLHPPLGMVQLVDDALDEPSPLAPPTACRNGDWCTTVSSHLNVHGYADRSAAPSMPLRASRCNDAAYAKSASVILWLLPRNVCSRSAFSSTARLSSTHAFAA